MATQHSDMVQSQVQASETGRWLCILSGRHMFASKRIWLSKGWTLGTEDIIDRWRELVHMIYKSNSSLKKKCFSWKTSF